MKTDWTWTRVGLVSDLTRRGISPAYTEEGGIPVVSQKCVRHELRFDPEPARFTDIQSQPVSEALLLREGDSLINSTGDGTLGRVAFFPGHDRAMTFDSHVTLVRPNTDKAVPRFLSYLLFDNENRFITFSQGSTKQIELSRDVVLDVSFPAIPIKLQSRIADYLDRETGQIDETITRIDKLIELLEERHQAAVDSSFAEISGPAIKLDFDIEYITSGSRGWSEFVRPEGERFLRITDLTRGQLKINDENPTFVQLPPGTEGTRSITRTGDLLFSITADLGIVAVVDGFHANSYVNQHVALVRLRQNLWLPKFVGYAVLSTETQRFLTMSGVGGTKTGLSLDHIRSVQLPHTSLAQQQDVINQIEETKAEATRMITIANRVKTLLQERRSALITAAVTGKIEV